MPWAGKHNDGRAAVLKTFYDVNTFWTIEEFDIRDIFGEGEKLTVFGSFTVRSVKLDKIFTSPFSIQLKLKDGLVTYMQYMEDTFGIAIVRTHHPVGQTELSLKDGSKKLDNEPRDFRLKAVKSGSVPIVRQAFGPTEHRVTTSCCNPYTF